MIKYAAVFTAISAIAVAQDTPTEREAAKDVLAKMGQLERSIDVAGLVSRLNGDDPERDRVAARAKELMNSGLLAMGDDITRHPEIGFVEFHSVEKLVTWLSDHGFEIKSGQANLKTAFVAQWKHNNGSPHMGVIVEYDALRGTTRPFHGDQHSTQGPIGFAAAIAMTQYLERTHTPGSITIFGTPGEEMMPPNAKADLFDAGVFNGMDVIVRSHSSSTTSRAAPGFGSCCLNIDGVKYIFSGAPSHQMTPWAGRNALEAVIHLFVNIDAVRATIRPEARIQGIITEGGAAPNVVPDRTVADFYVRYPDEVYLAQVREFTDNAARAAALATGTKVKIETYGKDRDGVSVASLSEVGFAFMKRYGATHVADAPGKPQGYDETGTVSREIPGVGFQAHTSDYANHTYEMEADALTEVGHQGFVVDAESMAALLYEFASHPDYRALVSREFKEIRVLFDEYREALTKIYRKPNVPDPQ